MKHIFSKPENLPRCTELGFKVVDCPAEVWQNILKIYEVEKKNPNVEEFAEKSWMITGGDPTGNTEIFNLHNQRELRDKIHAQLLPLHEEWSGHKLIPTFVYGIRSYLDGVSLTMHVDRIETHHISAIVVVDKDEIGLYELFKVSNYRIGINSTAIVEGMTFNLKTFILKDSWYLEMIDFIKDGYVKLIESDDEVISGINKNNFKLIDAHEPYLDNSFENLEKELQS